MTDYISYLRGMVGHSKVIMTFAGGCVVDSAGRLLLQKRAGANVWGLPGGSMELGESAEMTAIREIREETGINVKVDALQGIYTQYDAVYANGDQAQAILLTFLCSVESGELSDADPETAEVRFFERDELPILFCQQHNDILQDWLDGKTGVYR